MSRFLCQTAGYPHVARHDPGLHVGLRLSKPLAVSEPQPANTCGNYSIYLKCMPMSIWTALSDCVAAVGFVAFARFRKVSNLMVKVYSKYYSSLRLVNHRLGDIEEAKSDQTLVSIILLGLYVVCYHIINSFIQANMESGRIRAVAPAQ